jgi:DNA-binding IclR family transcriptional regulator
VVDVVELLARRSERALTLTDLVRELGLTYATAHAILGTLAERGWVRRNAADKSYRLGPALALAAQRATSTASPEHAVQATAAALAEQLGLATSVTEIVAGAVVITAFFTPDRSDVRARPGDRVPLAAPFGGGFVAFQPAAARRAWIERSGITDPAVKDRLGAALLAIRARGYAIERMSSSARQVVELARDLRADLASDAMRASIDRLLVEITSASHHADDLHDAPKAYVSTIAAPVFDGSGKIAFNVGVHPFRAISGRRIAQLAAVLLRATGGPPTDR